MNIVSKISENPPKAPNLTANILSSLDASLSSGQLSDLFTSFLAQIEPAPPPPANTQAPQTSQSQTTSQTSQNSSADDANAPSSAATANQAPVSQGQTSTGKFSRHHDVKGADGKGKTQNNKSKTTDTDTAATNNANASTDNTAPVTPAITTTPAITAASATSGNTNSDGKDDSGTNDKTANDAVTADLNASVVAPVVTPTAPVTTPTAPASAPVTSDLTNTSDTTTSDDATSPQLALLLMQLERLAAAARLSGQGTLNAGTANAQGTQSADANLPASTDGTQGKTDLKSLLSAITKSNVANFLGGDTTSPADGANADQNSQDAAASVNAAATRQGTQPSVQPQTQQTAADKWMNASFSNLFNLANTDPNSSSVPLIFNAAVNAGTTTGNDDGAALDTDAQDQGGPSLHDTPANASSLGNNLLPQQQGVSQSANPYDFASQLSAMRAVKGGATGLPTPIEQVVLQLSRGLSKDGPTQMTIQLRPAELGRIDVKLNVGSDGKVQGTVTADNPATLNLLLKDVRGLERALQEAGLRADSGSLQFNLRGDGQTGGSFGQQAGNSPGSSGGSPSDGSTSLPVPGDAAETYYLTPGGVNMRV